MFKCIYLSIYFSNPLDMISKLFCSQNYQVSREHVLLEYPFHFCSIIFMFPMHKWCLSIMILIRTKCCLFLTNFMIWMTLHVHSWYFMSVVLIRNSEKFVWKRRGFGQCWHQHGGGGQPMILMKNNDRKIMTESKKLAVILYISISIYLYLYIRCTTYMILNNLSGYIYRNNRKKIIEIE